MNSIAIVPLFAAVILSAAPVVIAAIGETISEKAGIINLSLDGTILLSAMVAFVAAYQTNSILLGFLSAAFIGALIAAIIACFSLYLKLSQVAVGFVLTLLARDIAYFIGNPYSRLHGPQLQPFTIPFLDGIPVLGPIFFQHNILVYASLLIIPAAAWFLYRTSPGLKIRAVGEAPAAAFSRGLKYHAHQLFAAILGGALVGLSGAAFSLCVKPGWGRPQGAEGAGWIVLALVIFGGWNPVRAAIGAYFFAFLQVAGINLQTIFPSLPAQVFQVAPFPLMIFMLVVINFAQKPQIRHLARKKKGFNTLLSLLSGNPPAALGKTQTFDHQ